MSAVGRLLPLAFIKICRIL